MYKIFTGTDRAKIATEVRKYLGENYEVYDGATLQPGDLQNICQGTSLFNEQRRILIKDLTPVEHTAEAADPYVELQQYLQTPHQIAIWETAISRKKSYKDFAASPGVQVVKLDQPPAVDARQVFNIFDTALRDGPAAVRLATEIEPTQDPYMFIGLLASQATRRYATRPTAREVRILKALAALDMQTKSTAVEPWTLIKAFLLQLSAI